MARRSDHSREELAAMVIGGARTIVREEGWRAVSMRGVAARIGYAPGSIYNAVGDIDAVLLRVNADTLSQLLGQLRTAAARSGLGKEGTLAVADAYVTYVIEHARLWAALNRIARSCSRELPGSISILTSRCWAAVPTGRTGEAAAMTYA